VTPGRFHFVASFRQSVITVPSAGIHAVRVFAKVSADGTWGLADISMTVE
jgi:hypothetical protein